MRTHQITLRKGGPVHAVEFLGKGKYGLTTLCGANIHTLANPKARRFESANGQCQRCAHSITLR